MIFGALSNVAYRASVVSDPDGEAEQTSQEGGKSQHLTKSPVKRQSSACEQSMFGAEGVILVVDLDHPKKKRRLFLRKKRSEFIYESVDDSISNHNNALDNIKGTIC